jgi:hypothetical protein
LVVTGEHRDVPPAPYDESCGGSEQQADAAEHHEQIHVAW